MSFESPETPEKIESEVHECPTGTFTIEYEESEDEPVIKDIVFKQERDIDGEDLEEEVVISLGEYLPEGWIFREGVHFGASSDDQEIKFPKGGFELDKSLTVMLHELGHANSYDRHKKAGTFEE